MRRSLIRRRPRRSRTVFVQCVTNTTAGYEWHGPWFVVTLEKAGTT